VWDSSGNLTRWSHHDKIKWQQQAQSLRQTIRMKRAVEIGKIQVILLVQFIEGVRILCSIEI
jgi:hypothetical protein